MSETTFMGVPRDRIDWCPRVDAAKCNDCMECADFCPHDVFAVNPDAKPQLTVAHPYHCVVFCRACSKTCGQDALSFPDKKETTAAIKQIRKDMKDA
jgi:NAD-dependent dihydropyrimidine dehydrogenase PreA subunit